MVCRYELMPGQALKEAVSYQVGLDMVGQLIEEVPCRVKRDGIEAGERSLSTVLQGWLLCVQKREEGLRRKSLRPLCDSGVVSPN